MVAGGDAWLPGGMHGCQGEHACVVARGCVWLLGGYVWLLGGMHGKGDIRGEGGACMAKGGMCGERRCAWRRRGVHGEGGCAWDTTRYRDMINERAVRILLECILVCNAKGPFTLSENGNTKEEDQRKSNEHKKKM